MKTLLFISLLFLVGCQKEPDYDDELNHQMSFLSERKEILIHGNKYSQAKIINGEAKINIILIDGEHDRREQRIQEMQEAFERAIRSTGLDQLYQEKEEAIEEAKSIDQKEKKKMKWRNL